MSKLLSPFVLVP